MVPGAGNPQALNRYAYVGNTPSGSTIQQAICMALTHMSTTASVESKENVYNQVTTVLGFLYHDIARGTEMDIESN